MGGAHSSADISHCANLEATAARPACEAAAHDSMNPPSTFDDGLMGAPSMGISGGDPSVFGHLGGDKRGAIGGADMGGGPAAQDMSGNINNDGGHGANSADAARKARYNKCIAKAVSADIRETSKGLR